MAARLGSLALVLLVGACMGRPAYEPPSVRVSPAYGAVTAGASARRTADSSASRSREIAAAPLGASANYTRSASPSPFWRGFGDSVLTQLIDEARRANPDVRAAEARLSSARVARRLAAFDLAPTITATGSASRTRQSIAQIPGLTSQLPQQDLWDVGFDAAWEIDIFGRVGRTVAAQRALVESADHALDDVQVSLSAEVARAYFELRGAQRELAVSQRNAENQRKTVGLTTDRLNAGRGTAFDTERAKSALQLTLAAAPLIEARVAASRHRIAVLLGRAPDALPRGLFEGGDLPQLPDTVRVGSPDQLVHRRPDVLEAERQLAAQTAFVGAAQAEYLPRLTLGASAGYVATRFDSLARPGTSRLIVGPTLSWPLLDLGRVKGRTDLANARRDEARAQYSAAVLRAVEETETALVSYDRAHARLALLQDAVQSSTRAAELAQQRFEAGLTDFLQVLDAQRTLIDAENQLAQGHTAAASALVAVYKAIGGTWPVK
jgi:multidrug efflux system outer membrane protein